MAKVGTDIKNFYLLGRDEGSFQGEVTSPIHYVSLMGPKDLLDKDKR